jgi:hypothetical protein
LAAPSGTPLVGATVSLYSSKAVSNASGCFKMRLASAYPLTFTAAALGYKAIEVPAKFGDYRLAVVLSPESSTTNSSVVWREVSLADSQATPDCP